jgi:hypothetical protein
MPQKVEETEEMLDVQVKSTPSTLVPVLIIPCYEGSRIEGRLWNRKPPYPWCFSRADWFLLWLDKTQFYPLAQDCFFDNFRLHYNESSQQFYSDPGVFTRIPGYGNVEVFLQSIRFSFSFFAVELKGNFGLELAGSELHGQFKASSRLDKHHQRIGFSGIQRRS